MLTNIQKHIDMVRNSGVQKEIMLLKVWRENHSLDFPSIYIEQLCIEKLSKNNQYNLADNFWQMLHYISDNIENKRVVDPSNCNNIISDSLTNSEKRQIVNQAQGSLEQKYWKDILWYDEINDNINNFVSLVVRTGRIKKLTPEIVRLLIDKVIVSEKVKSEDGYKRTVTICLTHVGEIELP